MSNGFIYVLDAHFIDKIEEKKKSWTPSACEISVFLTTFPTVHVDYTMSPHYRRQLKGDASNLLRNLVL
jgi:hypothetical protein